MGEGLFTAPGKCIQKFKQNAFAKNIHKINVSGYKLDDFFIV